MDERYGERIKPHEVRVAFGAAHSLTAAVPNLFGTRDLCCGRQFFHRWARGVGSSLTCSPLLIYCCATWFLAGHGFGLVHGLAWGLGTPDLQASTTSARGNSRLRSLTELCQTNTRVKGPPRKELCQTPQGPQRCTP